MDGSLGSSSGRFSRGGRFNGNGCLAFGTVVMRRGIESNGRRKNGVVSQVVLMSPSLSYKPVTSASRDRGNISHDPTCDSSRDPFATRTSRDLSARDPGNLQPCDPGKITHDLSRNWSSTTSPDKTRFERMSNLLINTWQIVGTINKTRPLNNQRTRDVT